MFWLFGKYARKRRLIKGLRRRPLDPAVLEQLQGLLSQEQRGDLPSNLLWQMHVLAVKRLRDLPKTDPCYPLVQLIRRGALWGVQIRATHGCL
jgi:hypothetical protein